MLLNFTPSYVNKLQLFYLNVVKRNLNNKPKNNINTNSILTALAGAITYDSAEEVIGRIQFETRHK